MVFMFLLWGSTREIFPDSKSRQSVNLLKKMLKKSKIALAFNLRSSAQTIAVFALPVKETRRLISLTKAVFKAC